MEKNTRFNLVTVSGPAADQHRANGLFATIEKECFSMLQ